MATDHLKKSDVKSPIVTDTDHLVVASAIAESNTRTLATAVEKTVSLAAQALRFDDAELKRAPIVLYVFSDVDQFHQFQRSVLKQRPEPNEFTLSDMRREIPFVAVSPRRGERSPNYENLAGHELCRALLARKGGNARPPDWMKDGFARAVQMRANPSSVGTDRGSVVRMAPRLPKGAKGTPVADRAWTTVGKDRDLVAASLMDFLTFGPGSEKLGTLLNGMVPEGGRDAPSFGEALMASGWMLEDFDREWRDWIARGSPLSK